MKRENSKIYGRIAHKVSVLIVLMLFSAVSFHASADEIRFSQIASSLEQKLLIKNDFEGSFIFQYPFRELQL